MENTEQEVVTLNDIVAHKAFDVLSFIAALKPNKRTKEPSVVFSQEDAMLTLQELTQLIHMVGWQVDLNTKENGNVEFTLSKQ
jgi:hypothetical protein